MVHQKGYSIQKYNYIRDKKKKCLYTFLNTNENTYLHTYTINKILQSSSNFFLQNIKIIKENIHETIRRSTCTGLLIILDSVFSLQGLTLPSLPGNNSRILPNFQKFLGR